MHPVTILTRPSLTSVVPGLPGADPTPEGTAVAADPEGTADASDADTGMTAVAAAPTPSPEYGR